MPSHSDAANTKAANVASRSRRWGRKRNLSISCSNDQKRIFPFVALQQKRSNPEIAFRVAA
jgi:hypothetical protein